MPPAPCALVIHRSGPVPHDRSTVVGHGSAMTVRQYLAEWIELQRLRLQPSTWHAYRQTVDGYLVPSLGDTTLDDLDPRQLERLYVDLLDHGGRSGRRLSLTTIRYVHAVLHKALADAVRTGVLATNVSDRVALPRHDPRRSDVGDGLNVWNAAQVRTFLDITRDDMHHNLWAVALGTGMRRGELLGLRWSDIAPDRGAVRVATSLTTIEGRPLLKTTKTNRVRRLHIDSHTAAALDRQHERNTASDLVFTDPDGSPLIPQRITHRFRRLVRRLPLPTIRLHDLRHVHATLLLQAGVPIKVVSERLGHATITLTLDTYAHVLPAMDRDAAERFGSIITPP
jgi:integrase